METATAPADPELGSKGFLFLKVFAFAGVGFGAFFWLMMEFMQPGRMGWPAAVWSGVLFGLLFGAVMAVMNGDQLIRVPASKTYEKIALAIASNAYALESSSPPRWVFKPTAAAGVLSPKIRMVRKAEEFVLVGPQKVVGKIAALLAA